MVDEKRTQPVKVGDHVRVLDRGHWRGFGGFVEELSAAEDEAWVRIPLTTNGFTDNYHVWVTTAELEVLP